MAESIAPTSGQPYLVEAKEFLEIMVTQKPEQWTNDITVADTEQTCAVLYVLDEKKKRLDGRQAFTDFGSAGISVLEVYHLNDTSQTMEEAHERIRNRLLNVK